MIKEFDELTTCCFSGHRILKKDFNEERLEFVIDEALKRGYRTFLVGMALGFDLKCFNVLLKKRSYNIDIIACVPCKEQDKFFNKKEKEEYNNLIKKADKIIYVNEEYSNGCMQQRNRFMVDNSSLLITYFYYPRGGTLYTVNYAKKQNKEIINIY